MRKDIDGTKVAFFGDITGGIQGAVLPAVEKRISVTGHNQHSIRDVGSKFPEVLNGLPVKHQRIWDCLCRGSPFPRCSALP